MLFTRLFALNSLLPLFVLASHPGRIHRHSSRHAPDIAVPGVASQPKDVPRALPAFPNAGHKSVRSAFKKRASGAGGKRRGQCHVRTASASSTSSVSWTTAATTTTSAWYSPAATSNAGAQGNINAANAYVNAQQVSSPTTTWSPTSTWSATPSASSTSSNGLLGSIVSGLLSITDPTCGWCDSSDSAPNGSEDWINCGITGAGWTPPQVNISQLVYVDLTSNGPFAGCSQYFYLFEQYGNQYGIPPIMLASFALQESSCNPQATGGNGEAGLMQLGSANCANAPGGNCYNLDYNVETGASYVASLLSQNNNNVFAAIGMYNGWRLGLTISEVYAVAGKDCTAQQNLDYVYQMVNGWMQNVEGNLIGKYFNLAQCS